MFFYSLILYVNIEGMLLAELIDFDSKYERFLKEIENSKENHVLTN